MATVPPPWALEDFPGAEQQFSEWLEQQFVVAYHTSAIAQCVDQSTGEILNDEVLQRTKAMAKFQALERTLSFKSTIERAQIWQLFNAHEKGWFRMLPPEFDNIEELLASMIELAGEGTTEYYDLTFLVKQVLPLIRKAGVSPEVIIGLAKQTSKARAAVPFLRELIRETSNVGETTQERQEEVKSTVVKVVEMINSDLPVRQFRDNMKEMRGKATHGPEPFKGRRYILNGSEVYLFHVDECQGRAIEIALHGLTSDIQVGDAVTLLRDIQHIIGGE